MRKIPNKKYFKKNGNLNGKRKKEKKERVNAKLLAQVVLKPSNRKHCGLACKAGVLLSKKCFFRLSPEV